MARSTRSRVGGTTGSPSVRPLSKRSSIGSGSARPAWAAGGLFEMRGGSARPVIARVSPDPISVIPGRLSRRRYAGFVIARRIAPLMLVLALASVARAVEPAAPGLGYDHPLTGRVWDVAQDRFVTLDALGTAVSGARFVLLGERHDHPEHHQFQAWLLWRK